MVLVLVSVLLSVVATVGLEVRTLLQWVREVKYATAAIEADPEYNPALSQHMIAPESIAVGAVLGQGAEGLVCKAAYASTEVAVKITRVTRFSAVPVLQQLQEAQLEAQTLQPLRHPNVVSFFGLSIQHASSEIVVMTILELCPNGSIDDYIRGDAAISWVQKLELCAGVARGMAYLHSKGVIHRDLKTANGMLSLACVVACSHAIHVVSCLCCCILSRHFYCLLLALLHALTLFMFFLACAVACSHAIHDVSCLRCCMLSRYFPVLLDRSYVPKIADFGLSKHQDSEHNQLMEEETTNIGTIVCGV
jgi:serine/threonine protein kinase